MTLGWAWPVISGPYAMQRSMYSLPSASLILHPFPDSMKRGYGLNALTGLDTPPGVTMWDSP